MLSRCVSGLAANSTNWRISMALWSSTQMAISTPGMTAIRNPAISFAAGLDLRRDSPRSAELAHADPSNVFQPVTRNDFMIRDFAPYAFVDGSISQFLTYSAGARYDALSFSNKDRLTPADSHETGAGVTSPRGTLSFRVPRRS